MKKWVIRNYSLRSLEMAYEHCINDPEEDASVDSELIPIAVNIGGQCFKPEAEYAAYLHTEKR